MGGDVEDKDGGDVIKMENYFIFSEILEQRVLETSLVCSAFLNWFLSSLLLRYVNNMQTNEICTIKIDMATLRITVW